jgi:hypothetical protein
MLDVEASRQSFLGPLFLPALDHARLAVIGLSGGGSHIVQQLAHIGFQNYLLFDPDIIEGTNLTRLVGATAADVVARTPKTEIARRAILSVQPRASVHTFQTRWQDNAEHLKCADIIFACVDSFLARRDIEALARRYRIPLIDIGMDVRHQSGGHRMAGQAVLCLPEGPCLFCQRVLTPELLAQESNAYGSAGPRPQVVWANAVLASTAIGMAMDLLTVWSGADGVCSFATLDGNKGTVGRDVRLDYCPARCSHYSEDDLGDPRTIRM